jgi:putative acetyltransferase
MPGVLDDPRFTAWPSGRFMERSGPLGRDAARSNKKLCIVATDARLLIDLLYGLSLREDCIHVKYGTVQRDGMYLGRCFLATDQAMAELTEALKGHAHLMVSVQDDDFFNPYRAPQPQPGTPAIYEDWPEHAAQVAAVHTQAFGRADEARMVAAVHASGASNVSLLADLNREIVGHVMLSPVSIEQRTEPPGLGLAPLAVLPAHQHCGVGSQLVHDALRRARLLGYAYAVVLGAPNYYKRFGFVPAARFGLRYEHAVPADVFMALELRAGALRTASGVVRYLPAFDAIER